MIGDQDVVYVDFDDLFDNDQLFPAMPSQQNYPQPGYSNYSDYQQMIRGEEQRHSSLHRSG